MKDKKLIILITIAFLIKLGIFAFTAIHSPEGKIEIDSHDYLITAKNLAQHHIFARSYDPENQSAEIYRTPGYPLFLAIFHYLLKIPLNGIIFIQILLTIICALIVFKAAQIINPRLAVFSAAIILFDPAITVYSLLILTETLYLLFISLFLLIFVLYLKHKKLNLLSLSALILALTTYIRPVSYFLGAVISFFIVYALIRSNDRRLRAAILHAILFSIIVYPLLWMWQYRNARLVNNEFIFSTITNITVESENASGLLKSYSRNTDPKSQGLPSVPYYCNVTSRCLMSLMTRPASFKYFEFRPLTVAGKTFAYPWVIFWLVCFLIGLAKMRGNIYYHFFALIISYFTAATVVGTMWGSSSRFRIPMMPYIAILAAFGWTHLSVWIKNIRKKS